MNTRILHRPYSSFQQLLVLLYQTEWCGWWWAILLFLLSMGPMVLLFHSSFLALLEHRHRFQSLEWQFGHDKVSNSLSDTCRSTHRCYRPSIHTSFDPLLIPQDDTKIPQTNQDQIMIWGDMAFRVLCENLDIPPRSKSLPSTHFACPSTIIGVNINPSHWCHSSMPLR